MDGVTGLGVRGDTVSGVWSSRFQAQRIGESRATERLPAGPKTLKDIFDIFFKAFRLWILPDLSPISDPTAYWWGYGSLRHNPGLKLRVRTKAPPYARDSYRLTARCRLMRDLRLERNGFHPYRQRRRRSSDTPLGQGRAALPDRAEGLYHESAGYAGSDHAAEHLGHSGQAVAGHRNFGEIGCARGARLSPGTA